MAKRVAGEAGCALREGLGLWTSGRCPQLPPVQTTTHLLPPGSPGRPPASHWSLASRRVCVLDSSQERWSVPVCWPIWGPRCPLPGRRERWAHSGLCLRLSDVGCGREDPASSGSCWRPHPTPAPHLTHMASPSLCILGVTSEMPVLWVLCVTKCPLVSSRESRRRAGAASWCCVCAHT